MLTPLRTRCSAPRLLAVPALLVWLAACGDDEQAGPASALDADGDSPDIIATDVSDEAPIGDALSAGDADTSVAEPVTCSGLFGAPNETTGLDASECAPVCSCSDTAWSFPDYTEADFEALTSLRFLGPDRLLVSPVESPYQQPGAVEVPADGAVCAVIVDGQGGYELADYSSAAEAEADGAQVTHGGVCGVCSNLADLTVYLQNPDLTTPVRECGLVGVRQGDEANLQCLRDIGFSEPCAWIWLHNTVNTRNECAAECFAALNDPFNNPDGSLNACLQCDEDLSGPVFKVGAGRTRRNSGLATAICRPCGEVLRIVHRYGQGS